MIARLTTVVALLLMAAPFAAEAEQASRARRVGVFYPGQRTESVEEAFGVRLGELGYVVGRNVVIEERSAKDGTPEQLAAIATELVAFPVDVLVAWGQNAATAAKKATGTIPIVFLNVADPVGVEFIESLRRPGGNMTGMTAMVDPDTPAKQLQLLKEAVPKLAHVAALHAQSTPSFGPLFESVSRAGTKLGVRVDPVSFQYGAELDAVFARVRKQGAHGLVVMGSAVTWTNRARIAELALAHRLPSIHSYRETVAAGGLMSLGVHFVEVAKLGAAYVAKILSGAKPADLPVEQPTKFELVINLKTAKALGLTMPPSLLLRADHVIE